MCMTPIDLLIAPSTIDNRDVNVYASTVCQANTASYMYLPYIVYLNTESPEKNKAANDSD